MSIEDLMIQILKDLKEQKKVTSADYEGDMETKALAVESLSDKGLIKNASVIRAGQGNKAQTVWIKDAQITFDGIHHLNKST